MFSSLRSKSKFMLVLSLIGFFDATFLAIKHYVDGPIPCAFLNGCDYVTASKYSMIGPAPVALIGVAYYLAVTILLLLYLDTEKHDFVFLAAGLILGGFGMSIYFVILQLFVIKALCIYCLTSAAVTTLLFIASVDIVVKKGLLKNW